MASLVIKSIRSAVTALERPEYRHDDDGVFTRFKLKNLELFVLCARKLGNDAQLRFDDGKVSTLGSLLQRIHDAIPYQWDEETFVKFSRAITNFNKEIGRWYDTLLVSLPQPTIDEVTDIIDAVLENVDGIFYEEHLRDRSSLPPTEAMVGKITFLKNFIGFATLRSVEPRQLLDNLLVHIQAVAVDAAHISYIYISYMYACWSREYLVEPNVPVLLHMFKMVDPRVDETYTQALTSSKLSTQLHSPIPDKNHDPSVIMKDFIDPLLLNFWERLHMDTPSFISANSELQLVYEGLRLLRSMLKEQPNKFDKRIGELTRVVIFDAGIIIFSFFQRDMKIIVPNSGLLQRISRIRQKVVGKHLSIPDLQRRIHGAREQVGRNDLPRTNELGFIDFVLENLLEMTSSKACYGFQSQFQMIHDELLTLRYSFGKIEGVRNEQKELEALWNVGIKIAYRVDSH